MTPRHDPHADGLRWHVHTAPAEVPDWLVALRRFRAEVLYNDGLRPSFRLPDGTFHDDDPADLHAHHVVATVDDLPVATLRVVPLAAAGRGFCDRLIGVDGVDDLLGRIGLARAEVWEGSGWAVQTTRRRAAMGARVLAAGSAVARDLGMATAIGAAGSRYGQLYRILAVGYQRADWLEPVHVPDLADDVHLVHGTLDNLRSGFRTLVEQTSDLLQWHDNSPTRVNGMTP